MINYWISYKICGKSTENCYKNDGFHSSNYQTITYFKETLWTMLHTDTIGHFEEDLKVLEKSLYEKHSSDNVDVEDVVILSVSRL